ncbi:glutaminyl-tRNA synthase (glutamine-hydrolysing) [Powellomyces hirtus]|uniref:Glutaminyl-tRNA synthase (Glutamine-hydrolysing) n=1 Tax=Powellomyces hirtus TaxID=109895 RepID=A0A507EHR0_9FUNG|nr:glutaminyl-tRNA synthase (glutamine-hydrolysing) [Powellomyces hirtus]
MDSQSTLDNLKTGSPSSSDRDVKIVQADTSVAGADGYYLHSLVSPTASGWLLQFLCYVVEYLGSALGLSYKIASDSNLFYLRNKNFADFPTYYPVPDPDTSVAAVEQSEEEKARDMEEFAQAGLKLKNRIFHSVADYNRAYKEKTVTPIEVAEAVIAAIESSNTAKSPPLLAIIKHNGEDILRQARESAKRHAAGKPLSILDGVPIAVKDELNVHGYITSVGTSFLSIVPERDAFAISKLRAAGALLIGKANMHEIGIDVTNVNPHTGTPRNPYNPEHCTGGSSGGSASAVAAGLCPIAVGADGGGSIRIPAAYCGVYGLKPTAGRISEDGAFQLAPTVGVLGPIAATAADMAIGYALMAGPDSADATTIRQPPVTLAPVSTGPDSLAGLRIGIYAPYFDDADPEIVKTCRAHLKQLTERGAILVDVAIPQLEAMRVAHANTITSEMAAAMAGYDRKQLSYGTRTALHVTSSQLRPSDYITAARVRTHAMRIFKNLYKTIDVLATPTTACTAPRIPHAALTLGWSDYTTSGKAMRFIFAANLCGLPAISVPAGYTAQGLPIGLQLQAKWWDEALLMRIAYASEDALGDTRRKPLVHWDLLATKK